VEDENFIKEFKNHSAAKSIHHGFIGGLLEHSLSVAKLCIYIADNYPIIKRDLLVTAALLHDVGKVKELSSFPENDYTDDGNLIGHITLGAMMVRDRIKEIPEFPEELGKELIHCILAHHGELEFGSPKKPSIVEAYVLAFADNTDAKIETFIEALNKGGETKEWLGYNKTLDSNIRRT
jgi:3'-5' exoribonuclease